MIHSDHLNEAKAMDGTLSKLSPEFVELLRGALLTLAQEHKTEHPPAEPKKPEKEKEKKPEEQVPLFWKLCSAALLSVSALIAVTLYNQLNNTASQLRGDVGQLRNDLGQLRTDLVPKDDYNSRIELIVKGIKDLQIYNKKTDTDWREGIQEQKATERELRQQVKAMEEELSQLRQQMTALEQKMTPKSTPPKDVRKTP